MVGFIDLLMPHLSALIGQDVGLLPTNQIGSLPKPANKLIKKLQLQIMIYINLFATLYYWNTIYYIVYILYHII